MAQFTLSIDDFEHGSARATLSDGIQQATLVASYISDAFGELAEAVLSLLRSPVLDVVSCSWQDEPGEWRWIFRRTGASVSLEILRFEDSFSRLLDARGERVFSADCSLLRLATQVKGQLHRLLNEHGEEGYALRWNHPFPIQTFQQMEERIDERKHFSVKHCS